MERISTRVSQKDFLAIKKISEETGESLSQTIRTLILESLKKDKDLERNILIEILMIMRSSNNQETITKALELVEKFKKTIVDKKG